MADNNKKPSLIERRRRARRVKEFTARQQALAEASAHLETGISSSAAPRRSLAAVAEAQATEARREAQRRRPGTVVSGLVVAAVAAMATIGMGLPSWGHGWNLPWLAGGAATCVAALTVVAAHWSTCSPRVRIGVAGVAAVTVLAFAWGASTSIIIDGEVISDRSDTAAAYRMAHDAVDDLETLQRYDELLTLDVAEARARFNEYERASADLRSMSAAWATTDPGAVPSGQFIDIARAMASAANFGAEALDRRAALLVENDLVLEQQLQENRIAFVEQAIVAGQYLAEVADLYGFELNPAHAEETVE